MFLKPISWLGMKELNVNTTKAHIHHQKNVLQHKINTKKLKPGIVASYDVQPGNGEGLFWFQCFINLSLTYLFRHLPTYCSPKIHTGQVPHGTTTQWYDCLLSDLAANLHYSEKHYNELASTAR